MSNKKLQSAGDLNRRHHLRPAKNFLGVLGRATRRLGIRRQENLVQRAVSKGQEHKPQEKVHPQPAKS